MGGSHPLLPVATVLYLLAVVADKKCAACANACHNSLIHPLASRHNCLAWQFVALLTDGDWGVVPCLVGIIMK